MSKGPGSIGVLCNGLATPCWNFPGRSPSAEAPELTAWGRRNGLLVCMGSFIYSDIDLEGTWLLRSCQRFSSTLSPLTCSPGGPGTPCLPGTPGNPCKIRGRGQGAWRKLFLSFPEQKEMFILPPTQRRVVFAEALTASCLPGAPSRTRAVQKINRMEHALFSWAFFKDF